MGRFSRLISRETAENAFKDEVRKILFERLKIDTSPSLNSRARMFETLIDVGWKKGEKPWETAIQAALSAYIILSRGNNKDQQFSHRIYVPLQFTIPIASVSGVISFEKASEYMAILGQHTREIMLRESDP